MSIIQDVVVLDFELSGLSKGLLSLHQQYPSVLLLIITSTVGATFKVYLPAGSRRRRRERSWGRAGTSLRARRVVMVVDDDSTVLNITTQTLMVFGYEVVGAENGAQAIAAYSRRAAEITLVLTDMAMPIIDGAGAHRGADTHRSLRRSPARTVADVLAARPRETYLVLAVTSGGSSSF